MEEKEILIAIIVTRFGDIKVELYPKDRRQNTVNCLFLWRKKDCLITGRLEGLHRDLYCSRVILTLRMKGVQSHSMENIEITGFRMIFRLSAGLSRWAEREM